MRKKKINRIPKNLCLSDLPDLSTNVLQKLYCQLTGRPLPQYRHRRFLIDNLAWIIQVQETGKDPEKVRRDLLKLAQKNPNNQNPRYLPGTRLVREWHGKTYEVVIEKEGYRWKNKHYRGLSQIAQEITGTRWSGPRFFGLRDKGNNKPPNEASIS